MVPHIFLVCLTICMFWANADTVETYGLGANTLELIFVVSRHGDRTPDSMYPKDPYGPNETYYPIGLGELTNPGKQRCYNIGQSLREKYGHFIGNIYTPGVLKAISSPYSRCRASLLSILAGLYPQVDNLQKWNNDINWQPIPYEYTPSGVDKLFTAFEICPNLQTLVQENYDNLFRSGVFDGYLDVIQYLRDNSGINEHLSQIALHLHSTLKSEEEWGLTLPAWTDSVWPEPITKLTAMGWETMVGSEKLKTLLGGYIMTHIVQSTYAKVNGEDSAKSRKMELLIGHDMNIAAILSWLGVFQPHSIPYGAYITFEIHNIIGIRVIKIFYQDYTTPNPQVISIPKCGILCPFDVFVNLYKPYFDSDALCY